MAIADLSRAQALNVLHDFMHALVIDGEPDLSVRQLSILLTVYLEPPPHTVRRLAAKLHVAKPVITRALDTMGRRELVTRRRDETDRRSVIVQRTEHGHRTMERLADALRSATRDLPA